MRLTQLLPGCADTEDDAGPTTHPGGAALGLTRCLIYPDGFAETGDGGLKVVSGAHQWRMATLSGNEHSNGFSPQQSPPPGAEGDAFFERTWLAGKVNPLTGEPLRIERFALPPGSMAVVLCHTPHAVEPRPTANGPRYCTLFAYRSPDPERRVQDFSHRNLGAWELEQDALAGRIPGVPAASPNLFSVY